MSILRECGGFISGGGGADNLGNHTASQNLNMNSFSITDASEIHVDDSVTTKTYFVNPLGGGTDFWRIENQANNFEITNLETSAKLVIKQSGQLNIFQPLTNFNANQILLFDSGNQEIYARPISGISGGSDNLGNHKATQHLNMAGFSVTGVNSFIGTSNIVDNTTYKDNAGGFEWFVDVDGSDSLTFTNFNTAEIPLTLNSNGSIKIANPSTSSDGGIHVLLHNSADGLIYRRLLSSISGADNLGNHKATQNLNMSGFAVTDAGGMTFGINNATGVYLSHQFSNTILGFFNESNDERVAAFSSTSHPSGATLWLGNTDAPFTRPPILNNTDYVLVWNSGGMAHGLVGLRDVNTLPGTGGGEVAGSGCSIAFSYANVDQSGIPSAPLEESSSDIQVEVKNDVINFWAGISGTWVLDKVFSGGDYFVGEVDNGNSGTSKTIDFSAKANQKLTLTGNCTLTFTAPSSARSVLIRFVQDGTGGRTVTLPGSVLGSMSLVSGANQQTVVNFYFDGTNYHV